jgi:hypothetical protein
MRRNPPGQTNRAGAGSAPAPLRKQPYSHIPIGIGSQSSKHWVEPGRQKTIWNISQYLSNFALRKTPGGGAHLIGTDGGFEARCFTKVIHHELKAILMSEPQTKLPASVPGLDNHFLADLEYRKSQPKVLLYSGDAFQQAQEPVELVSRISGIKNSTHYTGGTRIRFVGPIGRLNSWEHIKRGIHCLKPPYSSVTRIFGSSRVLCFCVCGGPAQVT